MRVLNETLEDNIIWYSDCAYDYWRVEASDDEIIDSLDTEGLTLEDDFDNDIDKAREYVADIYADGEEDLADLEDYIIPEIENKVNNNILFGVSSRGVLDLSDMRGSSMQNNILNFLYNNTAYSRGEISVNDGVVRLTNFGHDGSVSVDLYTLPLGRKLKKFISECTDLLDTARNERNDYDEDLTIDEVAEHILFGYIDYYGSDFLDMLEDDGHLTKSIINCIGYFSPIGWNGNL